MTSEKLQFIAGERRDGSADDVLTIVDPSTGDRLATGRAADVADVHTAVDAARAAFAGWSRTTPAERSDLLLRWAEVVRSRADKLPRRLQGIRVR
jgi:betaine-aldehyde dehydrogenase